jgi:hypothetical protein
MNLTMRSTNTKATSIPNCDREQRTDKPRAKFVKMLQKPHPEVAQFIVIIGQQLNGEGRLHVGQTVRFFAGRRRSAFMPDAFGRERDDHGAFLSPYVRRIVRRMA